MADPHAMNQTDTPQFSKKVLWGEALIQFWNVAVKGLGLVNSFFILTALSVYQFGLYQLILSALVIADNISAGIFDDVVVNDTARGLAEGKKAEAKRLFSEFAAFEIGIGILLTAVLFFGSNLIAAKYGADIGMFVKIASFIIVFEACKATQDLFFTATVSLAGFSVQAAQELVKLAFLVFFLSRGTVGIREVMIATVGASLVSLAYSSYFFIRAYTKSFAGVVAARGGKLIAVFRTYGIGVFLRYGASRITKNIRPWIIRFFINTEAVAFYTLAVNLITLAQSVFPITMVGRFLPWTARDRERLTYLFSRSIKYAWWGGVFAALIGYLVVPELVIFIFPKYAPAMPLFLALLPILPLYGVYKMHKSLLLVLREQKILTARLVSELFLVSGLDALLLPIMGVVGVGVEYTLTYAWRVTLFHTQLRRAHPELKIKLRSLFRFDREDRILLEKIFAEVTRFLPKVSLG